MEENYGHLEIRLAELIEKKGLNRNKVSLRAAMNWRQVDRYCENDITRLDTFVLCKLCTALECEIQDLLVFVPAEKEQEK
ncbi:helix-turn-helix transcriptional regulator [Lachnospiraceae bacterium 29-84]